MIVGDDMKAFYLSAAVAFAMLAFADLALARAI